MVSNDIDNISMVGKVGFALLAIVSGIVHWGQRDLDKYSLCKKFWLCLYDVACSGSIAVFVGLIVYGYTKDLGMSLGVGGMAGHMGTRTIYLFEQYLEQRMKNGN